MWRRAATPSAIAIVVTLCAGCGGGDKPSPKQPDKQAKVNQLLHDPNSYENGFFVVRGVAYPTKGGFFLSQGHEAIWVSGIPRETALRPGDRVMVRGQLAWNPTDRTKAVIDQVRGAREDVCRAIKKGGASGNDVYVVFNALKERRAGTAAASRAHTCAS